MTEDTEPIKQEIEATRDSLSATLDQIESRVRDDVGKKVEEVRATFDWRHWVDQRPLVAFGVAITLGFWLGRH